MTRIENILAKLKSNYWLILILGIGALLRFYKIDFQSPWLDEMFTLEISNPNLKELDVFKKIKYDGVHPPFYYFLVYYVFELFGHSTAVLRSISAIFGVASILGMYVLGKDLYNKNSGLIASSFTMVNLFHIYYSQEGRMYTLLFFLTIGSFIYFIRFIKSQTNENLLFYILFISLAINTHFFAAFVAISQYAILAHCLGNKFYLKKSGFKIRLALATILILLLIFPSIYILLNREMEKGVTWIPKPEFDFISKMLLELFGTSELIIIILSFLIINYFLVVSKVKSLYFLNINWFKNTKSFTFLIIFTWFFLGFLFPFFISYISMPIIFNRYMIIILAPLILMASFGLIFQRNQLIKTTLFSIFIIISLLHLFFVKDYYNTVTKTQFREIGKYIEKHNTINSPVISTKSQFFNYFTNNVNNQPQNLEQHIQNYFIDSLNLKSFWYANAHNEPYDAKLTEKSEQFINRHFVIMEGIQMHDAGAKHFVPIKFYQDKKQNVDPANLSIHSELVQINIESLQVDKSITMKGWAFLNKENPENYVMKIIAFKDNITQYLPTRNETRKDVSDYFKNPKLSESGFQSVFPKNLLNPGFYKIGIEFYDENEKLVARQLTDKSFEISSQETD